MGMSSSIPTWLHYQHKSHLDLIEALRMNRYGGKQLQANGPFLKIGLKKFYSNN